MPQNNNVFNKAAEGVPATKNTFAEHGNEIEEIISNRMPFAVRWGTVFFFSLLLGIAGICWFIQYPDIVVAQARLNGINAPRQVVTKTDGKLIKIVVKENVDVQQGQLLAYMESIANPTSVNAISHQLDSITELISRNHTDEIIQFLPSNIAPVSGIRDEALGELQTPYQVFMQAFITFRDFLSSGFYLRKKVMLLKDMQNIQKLNSILSTQKTLLTQDLSLSNETYDASKSLADDKVISSLDYRNEKSKLIAKQLSLPQINTSIVLNESQQNEKRKEIADLENQIIVQKNIFIQALQTMKSQVQAWEYKYLLKAPVAGRVSFTGFFQENQEMKAGQTLFYIQPVNTAYFVEMLVPQYNFGKVKKGQRVLLKFQAYPNEQYGAVNGIIDFISTTPSDSGYLAKVILPNQLITNYKKPLQYHNGLTAQAEIITEDMRLLERFYYNLVKQMRK
ncbi:MAG: HlyD family efflux transporter periplasmic adaptor subunit [Ferruginibacter sp.]